MKVSTVEQMRAMDRAAVEDFGISEMLLMENAALAACAVLDREIGIAGRKILIFCGGGNNGGDGFAVARKCLSMGGYPKVFMLSAPDKHKGASKENFEILSRLPIDIVQVESAESMGHDLAHCDVVVDAMLGTGLDREVSGLFSEVIGRVNGSGKKVLSLDIPSGVNGDSGRVMGCSVAADYTVTFGLPKAGNLLMPGHHLCGDLFVTHISFPPELYDSRDIHIEINTPPPLPRRNPEGHKGSFGEALFIAGASGYLGAPYLSAMSFLKAGGGYSRLACPEGIMPFIASKGSEIVCIPLKQTLSGSISYKSKETLLNLADKVDIVIMGPGLSLNEETSGLARELAVEIDKPLIIDADGIAADGHQRFAYLGQS